MNDGNVFELVLHHRYAEPDARDFSGHGNDGYSAWQHGDGNGPQAAVFDGVRDRIFVPPSRTLARPGGVRTELVVRLDELGHRRTLIEGYLSFAVYVEANGALGAGVYRYLNWYGIGSRPALVSLGTWATITFMYTDDGVMALFLNGDLVADGYRRLGPANGIEWPFGLSIGAWPDADQRVLKGQIAEVKLWRSPPPRLPR
ncbi:LamG-like jellyroll fold domain-containing protein [Streptosporangium sp. NPDC005286]|uniref:LamG-like jellyroll fold domain-containing protein n=1 Tax=Streptosporangium sp. NPDC005286 TaxID=3154463 RepID=UPI0033AD67A6